MSTLKVSAINNPSASHGGLTISSSGLVSGAGVDRIISHTFTAVSTVSIDNCFSASYDNYRIVYEGFGSVTQDVLLRLRATGVDEVAANYNWTNQDNSTATNSTAQTSTILAINETSRGAAVGDIFSPNLTQETVGISLCRRPSTATRQTSWDHTLTTQYDGLTLFTSTGTMTGTVRIYGYRN